MQLDELKKNMSTLEQVLAKNSSDIRINVMASETAQRKLLKKYRNGFVSCAILAVIFTLSWMGKGTLQSFSVYHRGFLAVYLTLGALWYIFLYSTLKNINISLLTPVKLLKATTRLKIYTLCGETVTAIGLAVFFSMFLPDLFEVNPPAFWMCVTTLIVAIVSSTIYILPKYTKLLNTLNSIEE